MNNRFLRMARKLAECSESRYKLGACVVRSGRVFGTGRNNVCRTHKSIQRYFQYPSVHAEIAAILGLERDIIRGATVYVFRVKRTGEVGLSRPCDNCIRVLALLGIRAVMFSTEIAPFYAILQLN